MHRVARLLPLFFVLVLLASSEISGQQATPPPKVKPDFVVTAKAIAEEFKSDNPGAIAKYKDKIIEVTGLIKNAGIDKSDAPFLLLDGFPGAFGGVHCVTQDKTPWKKAMPGQVVTLRGKVPEFATLARLTECEIGDVKGPQLPVVTATKLSQEYRLNPAGTDKKYEGKWIILLGEVASVAAIDVGEDAMAALVTFKTDGKAPNIGARFFGNDNKMTTGLEAGAKLKVLGTFGPSNKDDVHISSSLKLDFK
jgi:hypothetical protein